MNIFSIFGVVMGMFMISLCVIYARTKRVGHNNLFEMMLLSVGAIALATLTVIYPTWWMVGIESYALLGGWAYMISDYNKVKDYLRPYSKHRKTRKILKDSSVYLCFSILVAIPVTMLVKCWSLLVGIVFIPIGAFSLILLLALLNSVLKDIWHP